MRRILIVDPAYSRKRVVDDYAVAKLRERYQITDRLARTIAELAKLGGLERESGR